MMRAAIGALALALTLAGCGATSKETPKAEPDNKPTTTLTPTEEAAEPIPTGPVEPNTGDRALRVGQTRKGTGLSTRLIQIRYPYPPGEFREPQKGKQFLGLKIHQCMYPDFDTQGEENFGTYNGEWYAVSPNGNQATSSSSWNDWPAPKFPENVTLNPGDCLRGWITTEVPSGMKIEKIVWRPGGTDSAAEWLP